MNISVCIITKNEAHYLRECLSCLMKYTFEIVVTDTGSEDDSVSVAKEYTDKVFFYEWCNDFSAARNYCVAQATNDMVMIVDTDEFVQDFDWANFCKIVETNHDKVGRINLNNIYRRNGILNSTNERLSRIFDRRLYTYTGSIHEQITPIGDKDTFETYDAGITFKHVGYDGDPENIKKKTERNIMLLKSELEKKEDAYILYQLGKSYYMAGDYGEAEKYFERATAYDLDPRLEYVLDMIVSYGYSMVNSGKAKEALAFSNLFDEFSYSADYVFMMGIVCMNNALFEDAVGLFEKAKEYDNCNLCGVNSYLADYNIGVIFECLGHKEEALMYYGKCKGYDKAEERIKALTEN